MTRPRSLFWRTLQVAALAVCVVVLVAMLVPPLITVGITLGWILADLRDWWSRCRARAQGAE